MNCIWMYEKISSNRILHESDKSRYVISSERLQNNEQTEFGVVYDTQMK